jgi:hypothetical protein
MSIAVTVGIISITNTAAIGTNSIYTNTVVFIVAVMSSR